MVTLPLQFLLTSAVVRRLGLGGTLAVTPVCIAGCSTAMMAMPGLGPAMAGELVDSATRYTITRTAMELLYLPHPADVRNRVKTFVDVFVDRMSRGIGGILLAALLSMGIRDRREIGALMSVSASFGPIFCAGAAGTCARCGTGWCGGVWTWTVRGERQRSGDDRDSRGSGRRLSAAAGLLRAQHAGGSSDFDLHPLPVNWRQSPRGVARVYEVAWFVRFDELEEQALAETRRATPPADTGPAYAGSRVRAVLCQGRIRACAGTHQH